MISRSMEQRYKDALRQLHRSRVNPNELPSNYASALFSTSKSYLKKYQAPKAAVITSEVKTVTEKTIILDSFHRFGEDKLKENGNQPVSVPGGGEISIKIDSVKNGLIANTFEDVATYGQEEFKQSLSNSDANFYTDDRYKSETVNKADLDKMKVIFISDSYQNCDLSEVQDELKEFFCLFDPSTAILFSKMVSAMKLNKEDYLLSALQENNSESGDAKNILSPILEEVLHFKPQLVITLGVSSSHALLNIKDRLKDIHGKFYNIVLNDFSVKVMPLFSPSLLNTAVNMKKIAWLDMQNAMKILE